MCYRDNAPVLDLEPLHVACLCGQNGHGKTAPPRRHHLGAVGPRQGADAGGARPPGRARHVRRPGVHGPRPETPRHPPSLAPVAGRAGEHHPRAADLIRQRLPPHIGQHTQGDRGQDQRSPPHGLRHLHQHRLPPAGRRRPAHHQQARRPQENARGGARPLLLRPPRGDGARTLPVAPGRPPRRDRLDRAPEAGDGEPPPAPGGARRGYYGPGQVGAGGGAGPHASRGPASRRRGARPPPATTSPAWSGSSPKVGTRSTGCAAGSPPTRSWSSSTGRP